MQVVHGEWFRERAGEQYITPSNYAFERGSIFFQKKNSDLLGGGVVTTGFKVAINSNKISDPEAVYLALSEITDLDKDKFLKTIAKKDSYEEVVHRLTKELADRVAVLNLPGVSVFKEKWRFYPGANLASHVLGIMGFKGDEFSGRYGIERSYEDVLARGRESLNVNFFAEVFANISKSLLGESSKEGDLILTIEPSVQGFLENELKNLRETWKVDLAGAIIMNPKTGSVYAMSSKPDFDPNDFSKEDLSVFVNPSVENIFEFGSVMKPLVMSGALDIGAVTPETTYQDTGSVIVHNKVIENFDGKGRGKVNMQEVLNKSLNTGMVFVAGKMGQDQVRNYLFAYGLGQPTGIDLPGEVNGSVQNLYSKRDLEYATAAFGQGVALTPIQAARAFAALGNGGYLVTPHLVEKIHYDSRPEKVLEYPPSITAVIKPETSETITRMLVGVADNLSSGTAKIENYSVAAKTGTAQVAKEDGRGYYDDQHLHSMFAYFPAYDPQFLVFFYLKNPKGVQYAANSLTPSTMKTARFLINYYEVSPDR